MKVVPTLLAASHPPDTVASHIEPALLRARDAARLCGISLASWWRWDAAGRIPRGVKIGGARLWSRSELLAWIDTGCPDRAEWQARQAAKGDGRRS
jgi:predicted DNA-binding transcriptional regulator AlpA